MRKRKEKRKRDLVNGVEDELSESTDISLTTSLVPLLLTGTVEVVSPESGHELGGLDTELGSIHLSEVLEGEGPAVEARAETNGAVRGVDSNVTHGAILITICGDDDVDVIDDTLQGNGEPAKIKLC